MFIERERERKGNMQISVLYFRKWLQNVAKMSSLVNLQSQQNSIKISSVFFCVVELSQMILKFILKNKQMKISSSSHKITSTVCKEKAKSNFNRMYYTETIIKTP